MKHPYAEILIALAGGKEIEYLIPYTDFMWRTRTQLQVFQLIVDNVNPQFLRVKPETITINGITIVASETKPLKFGQIYYVTNLTGATITYMTWSDSLVEREWLNDGIIHLTHENAIEHRNALLSFTQK